MVPTLTGHQIVGRQQAHVPPQDAFLGQGVEAPLIGVLNLSFIEIEQPGLAGDQCPRLTAAIHMETQKLWAIEIAHLMNQGGNPPTGCRQDDRGVNPWQSAIWPRA